MATPGLPKFGPDIYDILPESVAASLLKADPSKSSQRPCNLLGVYLDIEKGGMAEHVPYVEWNPEVQVPPQETQVDPDCILIIWSKQALVIARANRAIASMESLKNSILRKETSVLAADPGRIAP